MRTAWSLLMLAILLAHRGGAAAPGTDPDWPCAQPLVETVSAAMLWRGPPLDAEIDWQSDPAAATLAGAILPREVATADGLAAIAAYLGQHRQARQAAILRAAAGLLQENNLARAKLLAQIKNLAVRQRGLADIVAALNHERALPDRFDDAELLERWNFSRRSFYEMQQTLRYVCEIPAQLDRRLGQYLDALAAGLR